MDTIIKSWMNEVVQVQAPMATDGAGDPTLQPPIDLYCYSYGGGSRLVRNRQGDEVVCTKILCTEGNALVHLKDFVYIDGRRYPILDIIPYYDDIGNVEIVEVLL